MKDINENTASDKTKNASFGFTSLLFNIFNNPLNTFFAAALVITASSRLSYALVAAACLVFVFSLSCLLMYVAENAHRFFAARNGISLLPRRGKNLIFIFLSNFAGAIFYFGYYLFNPLLAAETIFITLFVPILAYFYEANKTKSANAVQTTTVDRPLELRDRLFDALKLACLIIVLSCIREPLGYATLSLPFGGGGITELFNQDGAFTLSIEIVSLSSGAFLILGFIIAQFQALDRRKTERS